jgi:hypothetical protein
LKKEGKTDGNVRLKSMKKNSSLIFTKFISAKRAKEEREKPGNGKRKFMGSKKNRNIKELECA